MTGLMLHYFILLHNVSSSVNTHNKMATFWHLASLQIHKCLQVRHLWRVRVVH